jgi:hypothetical protein
VLFGWVLSHVASHPTLKGSANDMHVSGFGVLQAQVQRMGEEAAERERVHQAFTEEVRLRSDDLRIVHQDAQQSARFCVPEATHR